MVFHGNVSKSVAHRIVINSVLETLELCGAEEYDIQIQ